MAQNNPAAVERIDRDLLAQHELPPIADDAGKEERGRVLLIAGSRELAGAAMLAGVAALRAGAGKLQVATAESIAAEVAVAIPEARVITYPEAEDGCVAEKGVEPLLGWAEGAQAIILGCGLRHGPGLESLLRRLLGLAAARPIVIDAAGLDCLDAAAGELRRSRCPAILLPHPGELARVLEMAKEEVSAHPLAAARHASERFRAVTLVKGAPSHLMAPDGRAFVFGGGGVGLATSGSGDVLAGIVGGLCARGADPLSAALWGVWLHGEAGRVLADRVGRVGFLAREIADEVPGLLPD